MTIGKYEIDTLLNEADTDIGREFYFWLSAYPEGYEFTFSSQLENIGDPGKHDVLLKNKTRVLVLSDPTEAYHPSRGNFLVAKVLAHTTVWLPINSLVPIDRS